jgi:GNAT superfamily N-acetyltransferase
MEFREIFGDGRAYYKRVEEMMIADALCDPVWNALSTEHARFMICEGRARRYPAAVAPFAAVADHSPVSWADLEQLLSPGEHVYLCGPEPAGANGLQVGGPLYTHQMVWPSQMPIEADRDEMPILRMTAAADADAMMALTTLAFPGFFRERTHEMGSYYGIRVDGELVAMAGERLALPGMREISAVVTRPGHTGKGYARALMNCLLREHLSAGYRSFLHVGVRNTRAVALYNRMGFTMAGSIALWPVSLAR